MTGPVGVGEAVVEEEVEDTEDADVDVNVDDELTELVVVDEFDTPVIVGETVELVALVDVEETDVVVRFELSLYIDSRLPAPQYSDELPAQTMLQSPWFATRALPAFGADPQ